MRLAVSSCCALLLAAAGPASAESLFFVDPVNGSDAGDGSSARPWRSLQAVVDHKVETRGWESLPFTGKRLVTVNAGAPVKAGDVIRLRSGDHGALSIVGAYNLADVTVAAEVGATPRLTRVLVRSAAHWVLHGLSVSPSHGTAPAGGAIVAVESHDWSGPASDVVLDGLEVFTVPDEAAWPTAAAWDAGAADGIVADGDRITVRQCRVRNVAYGIVATGQGSRVEHNLVDGFSGDGLRGLGDDEVFEYNLVRNARDVNADHRDGFQSWSVGPGGVGTGAVRNVTLRGNVIIGWQDPAVRFAGTLQGIGCFDGTYDGWVVENNVVITDHWHGISFYGARNLRISNNTVLDLNDVDPGPPWIMVTAHKDGTPSSDSLVQNNLAAALSVEGSNVVSRSNLLLPARAAGWFVDLAHHDLRLAAGTPAEDAGATDQAPAVDADGVARPFGRGVDVGAFEYAPGVARPPDGAAGPGAAPAGPAPAGGGLPSGSWGCHCGQAGADPSGVLALLAALPLGRRRTGGGPKPARLRLPRPAHRPAHRRRRAPGDGPGPAEGSRHAPRAASLWALAALAASACLGKSGGAGSTPPVAPRIAAFGAAPSAVPLGRPTRVTWAWTYAAPPSPAPACAIDGGVGTVASGGATSIAPTADTVYRLTCTNGSGSDTAATTVTVAAAAILPPDRLPLPGTWESAGVEGGIPRRTAVCADVTRAPYRADATGGASAVAAIQGAIDACPDGQVVSVPAGTYLIDGALTIRRAITLRGAGPATVFRVATGGAAIHLGGLGPWPPPKANPSYRTPIAGGASRGSTAVTVADASRVEVGKMVMVDELDDPGLVWTKNDSPGRYRASMHLVDSKTATSVTFHPPLPIDFTRSPQLSWFPDLTRDAGVEGIKFLGTGSGPGLFIDIFSAWNCWVLDCEFTAMPSKTIVVAWSGHIELRRIFMHDQSNGGPNSEGLDLLCDTSWSLVVDNTCVAGGFPQINIGDGGANPYYSGGFGNVIAYNYAVDAYYTDPPDSPDAGKMPFDIGTNHSPHAQYNLVEGNYAGKFGVDAYHGSGSHTVLLRNVFTGTSRWPGVTHPTAVQIDRRNLYTSLVGNVLGRVGKPTTLEYATGSGWSGSAIYRLGFPDGGNDGYSGTYPPTDLAHADGGPRDLYVERDTTGIGTTLIEGNWDSPLGRQDWTIAPLPIPDSYYLTSKPSFFGSLAWPPVDPTRPSTEDPGIIPAGYRYLHGSDPP